MATSLRPVLRKLRPWLWGWMAFHAVVALAGRLVAWRTDEGGEGSANIRRTITHYGLEMAPTNPRLSRMRVDLAMSGAELDLTALPRPETGLVVLKTTGSEFWGFPRDRYTTLAETLDRILATAVTARWRYRPGAAPDWDATYAGARTALLETFATTHSLALQQSLYAMGEAALERFDEIAEIRLSMPNKHHFLQDLSAYGLDNPDVVYHADDRPYGLIEGAVLRDDVPPAEIAWQGTPGFC